jgi:hypothetical protein
VEAALIRALDRRYQSDRVPEDDELRAWEDAYAAAMRDVYADFSNDLDVSALFAEALMNRTPWQLWDLERGEPAQGADTRRSNARAGTSAASDGRARGRSAPRHPPHVQPPHGNVTPPRTGPVGRRCAARCRGGRRPSSAHAFSYRHSCGDYYAALVANDRAIEADRKSLEREGPFNFYTLSRCHDYHFKLYAAMFLGQYRPVLKAANEMVATIPEALLRQATPPMADWLEGFVPMKAHVLVRFGRWQEIIDEPLNLYLVTTATLRYSLGCSGRARRRLVSVEESRHVPGLGRRGRMNVRV